MRKFFPVLLLLLAFLSCEEDDYLGVNYDNIELEQYVIDNYHKAAKYLYFREIRRDKSHHNYNNPELDSIEVIKVLKLIQAVYNCDIPERDEVFETYSILLDNYDVLNSLNLYVYDDAQEIKNFIAGIKPTGNVLLDSLLLSYGFEYVETLNSEFPNRSLIINSNNEYNILPIAMQFREVSIVTEVSLIESESNGRDIDLERNDSFTTIFFRSYIEPDSGLSYFKYWEFRVIDDYAVFVKTFEN